MKFYLSYSIFLISVFAVLAMVPIEEKLADRITPVSQIEISKVNVGAHSVDIEGSIKDKRIYTGNSSWSISDKAYGIQLFSKGQFFNKPNTFKIHFDDLSHIRQIYLIGPNEIEKKLIWDAGTKLN